MRLPNRIYSYIRELAFAFKHAESYAAAVRLALQMMRFHLHNFLQRPSHAQGEFEVGLWLQNSKIALHLRPCAGDLFIFAEVLIHECYRLPDDLCDPRRVRTILDCGANIGLASIYFAARYPEARIVAVEPDPSNYRLLVANARTNPRITAVQGCVAARDDAARYLSQDRPAWGNTLSAAADGIAVPAYSIESLCRKHDFERIDLLKVDIEGAEAEVFQEPTFLERVNLLVIELHGDYGLDRFRADLDRRNFEIVTSASNRPLPMVTARPGQPKTTSLATV